MAPPRVYLFLVVGIAALFFFTGTASAHSRPVRFDPEPGRVLETAPSSVQGWFSNEIRQTDTSFMRILDAQGRQVQPSDSEIGQDRRSMRVALPAELPDGAYIVHWSTFDDAYGEVFAGCYVFFVGQTAADSAVERGRALDGGGVCPVARDEQAAGAGHDPAGAGADPDSQGGDTEATSNAGGHGAVSVGTENGVAGWVLVSGVVLALGIGLSAHRWLSGSPIGPSERKMSGIVNWSTSNSAQNLLVLVAAVCSAGAAAIHFAVIGDHFDESWMYGVFFAVVAWFQVVWAFAMLRQPSEPLFWTGISGNAAVVLLWLVSRTLGIPAGPAVGEVEALGLADLVATILELVVVVACIAARRVSEPEDGRSRRTYFWPVAACVALVVGLATTASLIDLSGSESHGGAEGQPSEHASLPLSEPAAEIKSQGTMGGGRS